MITKDEVIILKTFDFQDSSKIVKGLSKTHGKLTLIAKGARNPKSKFSGYLQVGNVLESVFYYKPGRDMHTLSEVSFVVKVWSIQSQIDKLSLLLPTLEMLDQLTREQTESTDYFDFTKKLIQWLIEERHDVSTLFPYILIRLAELSGIQLMYDEEEFQEERTYYLNNDIGTISLIQESGLCIKLTPYQARYVYASIQRKTGYLRQMTMEKHEIKNLIHHLDVYFKLHFDDLHQRKSDQLLFDWLG